jgi:hypothetical protein
MPSELYDERCQDGETFRAVTASWWRRRKGNSHWLTELQLCNQLVATAILSQQIVYAQLIDGINEGKGLRYFPAFS